MPAANQLGTASIAIILPASAGHLDADQREPAAALARADAANTHASFIGQASARPTALVSFAHRHASGRRTREVCDMNLDRILVAIVLTAIAIVVGLWLSSDQFPLLLIQPGPV